MTTDPTFLRGLTHVGSVFASLVAASVRVVVRPSPWLAGVPMRERLRLVRDLWRQVPDLTITISFEDPS